MGLWEHIMNCKDQQCRKPHCVSSRYVLSHYSKCKETKCPVCGPVRDAILEHYNNKNNTQPPAKSQGGGATATGKKGSKPATAAPQTSVASTKDTKGQAAPEGKPAKPGRKKTKKDDQNDQTSARSGMNGNAQTAKTTVPKTNALDPVSCALYGFTNEQIQKHLNGLGEGVVNNKSSTEVKAICMPIIEGLLKHHSGHIFAQPVDPVQYNLPDYFDIIKNPMDLGSIKKRLEKVGGVDPYRDIKQVAADVSLVFDNAILYYPKEHDIHKVAIQLKRSAENQFDKLFIAQERKIQDAKKDINSCSLCGDGNCKFEPPVYYCQGNCGGQRIRRNAFYYSTSNNLNHWCQQCFSDLKENQAIIIPEKTIYKRDIAGSKKKHQEESDEPWVGCDICKRWVHQICGMFNSRRNVSDEVAYVCPNCVVERRNKTGEDNVLDGKKMRAVDLPHTNMSQFIQMRVEQRLDRAYKEKAEAEGIGIEAIEKCPLVSIRQVASIEKNQQVREGVRERYAHKNYPSEFPCRTKCVVLFQNIDGQDVVLFGMYVYEYGHNCPQPNQRRVYVSYLDSVHYFRPKQYRTMVYQEIIIAYLEYVKNRGFHTAHIWACPPLKGDDYILYCHPVQQKTPKDDMLRKWYQSVLNTCFERGIAHSISDLYTEFLANHVDDATILPYFEGDYWVNEAEVIIKDVKKHESREEKKKASNANLAALTNGDEDAAPVQKKKKGAPKRTRSGIKEPDVPTGPVNPDVVMAKLADIIKPMKEAFFVAHLHPPEYAEKWRVKEKEGSDSPDQRNNAKRAKVVDESMKEENFVDDVKEETNDSAGDSAVKMEVDEQKPGPVDGGNGNETQGTQEEKEKGDDGMDTNRSEGSKETGDNSGTIESKESTEIVVKEEKMDIEQNGAGDAKCGDEKNANIEPEVKNVTVGDSGSTAATTAASVENETVKVKVDPESEEEKEIKLMKFKNDMTEDVDDIQESDYFGTRQDVLQLCQGNHYQFDQLRRAKHTSMMILYHLHNPDAPKFVPLCTKCSKDILSGYRHNCETCGIDICHQCFTTKGPANQLHPHPLRAVSVANGQPAQQLTEEQRKEREKSIQMHLHLLNHASSCNSQCKSKNCARMREFLRHGQTCKNGTKGGCPLCKKIYNLLTLHARSCKNDNCKVPKCNEIRDQMRKMEQRQQAMDDRRRAMMNQTYGQQVSSGATGYE